MNLNQIEIKSTLLPWNSSKWAKISTKIDEKWDKNKNNGFGLGPQNLIIKFNKMNQNQWKLIIKWAKIEWNYCPFSGQILRKFNENDPKIEIKFKSIPVLPLKEFWEKITENW